MKRLLGYLAHLLPRSHVSQYGDGEGNLFVATWSQWLGRVSNHRRWRVVG